MHKINRAGAFIITILMIFSILGMPALTSAAASTDAEVDEYLDYLREIDYPALATDITFYDLTVGDDGFPLPMEFEMRRSVIGLKMADFDGDGANEMLAIVCVSRRGDYGPQNTITGLMLKKEGKTIGQVASCRLADYFMFANSDTGYCDVFLRQVNGEYEICCEALNSCGIWLDGMAWTLKTFTYIGGAFDSHCDFYESGSYFEDEDKIMSDVIKQGFYITKPFERITENSRQFELLCSVDFYYGGEWEAFYDIAYGRAVGDFAPIVVQLFAKSMPGQAVGAPDPGVLPGGNDAPGGSSSPGGSGSPGAGGPSAEVRGVIAQPTSSAVYVDGIPVLFEAYNIDDYNYFKLRDLAFVINGTPSQFGVVWDGAKNAITLTCGAPYVKDGSEMGAAGTSAKLAYPTDSAVYLDGASIKLTAYNIDGYNYFKLRDVGQAVGFDVDWNEAIEAIIIETSGGSDEYYIYTVKAGDTFYSIAVDLYGEVELFSLIASVNGLDLDALYPGMKIKIPALAQ